MTVRRPSFWSRLIRWLHLRLLPPRGRIEGRPATAREQTEFVYQALMDSKTIVLVSDRDEIINELTKMIVCLYRSIGGQDMTVQSVRQGELIKVELKPKDDPPEDY